MTVAAELKKLFQELVVPELKEIRTEQKTLHTELSSFRNEMKIEIKRLDEKIDSFRNEMRSETKRMDEKLETAMQIRERLAALESRVATLGH